jgi:hypothetical protein
MSRPSVSPGPPLRFISTLVLIFLTGTVTSGTAHSQFGNFGKKTLDSTLCAFGGIGLTKASQKIAEVETKRLKLPPAAAATQQRQLQIGMALALCGGGKSILNTTFAKMSEKDKKQRQDNIDAAVADTAPTTKTAPLPDHPELTETLTTDPIVADGDRECRTVKDYLADKSQGDTALVKYCRKPPDGKFEVATL